MNNKEIKSYNQEIWDNVFCPSSISRAKRDIKLPSFIPGINPLYCDPDDYELDYFRQDVDQMKEYLMITYGIKATDKEVGHIWEGYICTGWIIMDISTFALYVKEWIIASTQTELIRLNES